MEVIELGTGGKRLSSDEPMHAVVATKAATAMLRCIEQAGGSATILPFRNDSPPELTA